MSTAVSAEPGQRAAGSGDMPLSVRRGIYPDETPDHPLNLPRRVFYIVTGTSHWGIVGMIAERDE